MSSKRRPAFGLVTTLPLAKSASGKSILQNDYPRVLGGKRPLLQLDLPPEILSTIRRSRSTDTQKSVKPSNLAEIHTKLKARRKPELD